MSPVLALLWLAVAPPAPAMPAATGLAVRNADADDDAPAAAPADDDETPAELGGERPAPPRTAPTQPEEPAAAPAADAEPSPPVVEAASASDHATIDPDDPHLGLRLAAGLGMMLRAFDPGPLTLTRYRSTPVGAARVEVGVTPTPSTELTVAAERSLGMTTAIQGEAAATTSSRWEASAALYGHLGKVAIGPVIGGGSRDFSIESSSMVRSPDGNYDYLSLGARMVAPLGSHAELRLAAAFEPVYGGIDPNAMSFGPARRWGLDVGGALVIRLGHHLGLAAAVDYQRFSWAWPQAGDRGAGGAVDQYPTGIVSLAADY